MAIVVRHGTEGQRLGLLGALAGAAGGGRGGSRFVGRGQGTRGDQQAAAGLGQSSPEDMARLRLREAEIGLRNQAIEAQRKRLELDEKKLGIEEGEKAAKRELLGQQFDQAVNDSESELGRILDGRPEEQIKALRRLNPEDQQVMLEEWGDEYRQGKAMGMFEEAKHMEFSILGDPELSKLMGVEVEESMQELQELMSRGRFDRESLAGIESGLTDMRQAAGRLYRHMNERKHALEALEAYRIEQGIKPNGEGYEETIEAARAITFSTPGQNIAEMLDIGLNAVDIARGRKEALKEQEAEDRIRQEVEARTQQELEARARQESKAAEKRKKDDKLDQRIEEEDERFYSRQLRNFDPAAQEQYEAERGKTPTETKDIVAAALEGLEDAAPEQKMAALIAAAEQAGISEEDLAPFVREMLHGGG